MARFEEVKLFRDSILETRKCYFVSGYMTLDDVYKLNDEDDPVYLILENTKGQNSNIIGSLNGNKINISVLGGIDYINKRKYGLDADVMRTIYTPRALSNIIKIFEEIEKHISPSWNDSQKCIYVYKTIVETMSYDSDDSDEIINETIVTSNLNGLLFRKANNIGLALIFKEAMDRLDIECHYQSIKDLYSWNVVKIYGDYRVIDITWEICNKAREGRCSFKYYCRLDSTNFYSNKYHDISNDSEEVRFMARPIEDSTLLRDLESVIKPKYMISGNMIHFVNDKGQEFYYFLLGESHGMMVYIVRFRDFINYFYLDKNVNIETVLDNDLLADSCAYHNHSITGSKISGNVKRFSRYMREDGSNFLVCYADGETIGDIKSYIIIEPYTMDGKKVLIRTKIYSENDLVDLKQSKYKDVIANQLLSKKRLKRRIDNYGGYVGYIDDAILNA